MGIGAGGSLQSSASAVGPAAGTFLASLSLLGAQAYNIWAQAAIDLGAPVAADFSNMALFLGAANKTTLPYTTKFGGPFGPFRLTPVGPQNLSIQVVANATAGVLYVAALQAIPVP